MKEKCGLYMEHGYLIGGGTVHALKFMEYLAPYYDVTIFLPPNVPLHTPEWYKQTMNLDISNIKLETYRSGVEQEFKYLWFNGWHSQCWQNNFAEKKYSITWFPEVKHNVAGFKLLANSNYTTKYIKENWGIKDEQISTIYPPTSLDMFKPLTKKNIILHVSRIHPPTMSADKGHIPMIHTFKKMVDNGLKNWEFHLVGAKIDRPDANSYFKVLEKEIEGYPIRIKTNVSLEEMQEEYGESKIYWHAAGYSIKAPSAQEHFGLTTLEAMHAGCVPVVYGSGGQLEIVENGKSGFLFNDLYELQEKTIKLINDHKMIKKMSKESISRSKYFSEDKSKQSFYDEVTKTNKVSIIIGTYHNLPYLQRCIESILKCTPPGFELIVVNNDSDEDTKKYLDKLDYKVKIVNTPQNYSFSKLNNEGVKKSTRDYILFMNDDTEVDYNWLEKLIDVMENDKKVGAVQPRLIYPDGTVQADIIMFREKDMISYHVNQRQPISTANKPTQVDMLTAACILVRRKFAKFDENYIKGYFEDNDLFMNILDKGYKLFIQRSVNVKHYEGTTMGRNKKESMDYHAHNKNYFHQKWLKKLPKLVKIYKDYEFNGMFGEEKTTKIINKEIPMPENNPVTSKRRCLEIGVDCKPDKQDQEWEHFDIRRMPHVEHIGKADDMSRFSNDTFDQIYTAHTLEHLSYKEREKALKEWLRIIKKGGMLEIHVPDITTIMEYYLRSNDEKALLWIYGGQTYNDDFHKSGYSEQILTKLLQEAGFVNITRIYPKSIHDKEGGNLAMTGRKS